MYTWDEKKRASNLEKHGLDFAAAWRVHESGSKVTFASSRNDEPRKRDIAMVAVYGRVLTLAYVERDGAARCISFRRANRKEVKAYEAAYPGP